MDKSESKVRGAAFADLFCFGTRLVGRPRLLQRLVTGDNDYADGWVRIGREADTITSWIHLDGDPKGPHLPFPRLYRMAGLLAVEKDEMEELQAAHAWSRQALAIRCEDAVVVGALAEGSSYSDPQSPVGLATVRISRGDLEVAIGIYLPDQRDFLAAATARSLGRRHL